ncbi:hypothetical protein OFC46_02065 [Escherichia coli]|nr:hypothetical protein [Escherichia coli]
MESNIKGLVAAGHEMASELKAECGAVDMRSVAKLLSDLATQLEVQLARANALAAESAGLKSAHPQQFGQKMMDALVAYEECQDDVPERGMLNAFFILRDSVCIDTPATGAFLAEVRAQGVEMFAQKCNSKSEQSFASDIRDNWKLLGEHATDFAAELRKGGNQ